MKSHLPRWKMRLPVTKSCVLEGTVSLLYISRTATIFQTVRFLEKESPFYCFQTFFFNENGFGSRSFTICEYNVASKLDEVS